MKTKPQISITLASKLISTQFPEFADLPITDIQQQGHDHRTYRLGQDLLIRLPTDEPYALKVHKEQSILPKLAIHLNTQIPTPIRLGAPSQDYPYPFSIYQWIEGSSANLLTLNCIQLNSLALDLAHFLGQLQSIETSFGLPPGQHNWWRGDHTSVYDENARNQIKVLSSIIDANKALALWNAACDTRWECAPVWIHGDMAPGNFIIKNHKLAAVIDFGGTGVGDPACDLVIAWTVFNNESRDIFINTIVMDDNTWLRAKAWALWKSTFELTQMNDILSQEAQKYVAIINTVIN